MASGGATRIRSSDDSGFPAAGAAQVVDAPPCRFPLWPRRAHAAETVRTSSGPACSGCKRFLWPPPPRAAINHPTDRVVDESRGPSHWREPGEPEAAEKPGPQGRGFWAVFLLHGCEIASQHHRRPSSCPLPASHVPVSTAAAAAAAGNACSRRSSGSNRGPCWRPFRSGGNFWWMRRCRPRKTRPSRRSSTRHPAPAAASWPSGRPTAPTGSTSSRGSTIATARRSAADPSRSTNLCSCPPVTATRSRRPWRATATAGSWSPGSRKTPSPAATTCTTAWARWMARAW